jgi:hypothetical protein
MKQVCSIGEIPMVFLLENNSAEQPLFELLGYTIDGGKVFFEFMTTDLCVGLEKMQDSNVLTLQCAEKIYFKRTISKAMADLIQETQGVLLIFSSVPFDKLTMDQDNPTLEDIEQWIVLEEKRLGLYEGAIGGVLVGVR